MSRVARHHFLSVSLRYNGRQQNCGGKTLKVELEGFVNCSCDYGNRPLIIPEHE